MRNKLGGLFLAIVLSGALLGGWLGDRAQAEESDSDDLDQQLRVFTHAFALIKKHYGRDVESTELVESAIRGMLRTLDPHSSFFAAEDYTELQEEQQGKYFGLGILIRPEFAGSGRVVVVEPPASGTPGQKAGLRPGDVLSHINGEPMDDWIYPDEVIPKLKGPKGTTVRITVERPGEARPFDLDVERDAIPLFSIRYAFHLKPQVGYIRIEKFAETTSSELDEALERLGESNLKGLILDLRDNPGGSLTQAIEVADRFLEKKQVIVSTRGRRGIGRSYLAPRGRRHLYPMAVLINSHSASASEIVAGALQDHDRALIIGETSFGKALVQTVFPLRSDRGLALTTGKYYTPSNRLIQRPYEDGFWDYYFAKTPLSNSGNGDAYRTDGGRTVYGGGGIAPDVEEKIGNYTRLVEGANRRNLFHSFAGMLVRGDVVSDVRYQYSSSELDRWPEKKRRKLMKSLLVSERTLASLRQFLQDSGLEFTSEEHEESRLLLANRLRQELFVMLFGDREGMRIHLEIDNQVQMALEQLPRAAKLIAAGEETGKD